MSPCFWQCRFLV